MSFAIFDCGWIQEVRFQSAVLVDPATVLNCLFSFPTGGTCSYFVLICKQQLLFVLPVPLIDYAWTQTSRLTERTFRS